MAEPTPSLRRQSRFLRALHSLAVVTDDSLAAYMRELGEPVDPSLFSHFRAGRRRMGLGLFLQLLDHLDHPGEVLALLARRYRLRVVPHFGEGDKTTGSVMLELCDVLGAFGGLSGALKDAMADDKFDDDETERVNDLLDECEQQLAELRACVPARRRPRVVR